ncbi:glycosyltransferase family 61 protein [Arthrobacter sp. TmT3-37]
MASEVKPSSLDRIGLKNSIDQASNKHDYLSIYEDQLSRLKVDLKHLVLVSGRDPVATGNTFAEFLPDVAISILWVRPQINYDREQLKPNVSIFACSSTALTHEVMSRLPRPQVIIEDGTNKKSHKLSHFRELFYYLPHAGKYIIEDLHAKNIEELADIPGEDVSEFIFRLLDEKRRGQKPSSLSRDENALSRSISSYQHFGKIGLVEKSGHHLFKLRDYEATEILEKHYGQNWGQELYRTKGFKYASRATVTTNRPDLAHRFKDTLEIPDLIVREYKDVVCAPRQVCRTELFALPDSFRHSRAHRLSNEGLPEANLRFTEIPSSLHRKKLEGTYYYLDTEYPAHFGHISTEVLARLWGWAQAKATNPGLRALLSLKRNQESMPSFQRDLFEAFGISMSEVTYLESDTEAVVETLIGVTPQFSNPHWASPEITKTWVKIADQIAVKSPIHARRIFISRPQLPSRSCNNTAEVEGFFVSHGFEIVFPEQYAISEQIGIFRDADVVAGFAGSGLFNMMYATQPKLKIILAGENYIAMNEHLISSILGDRVHYVWGKSDLQYPSGRWTAEAFRSNFTIDLSAESSGIESALLESQR